MGCGGEGGRGEIESAPSSGRGTRALTDQVNWGGAQFFNSVRI